MRAAITNQPNPYTKVSAPVGRGDFLRFLRPITSTLYLPHYVAIPNERAFIWVSPVPPESWSVMCGTEGSCRAQSGAPRDITLCGPLRPPPTLMGAGSGRHRVAHAHSLGVSSPPCNPSQS